MAYRIMLDAGHGGDDPGATYQDRKEKDDALRLTLEVGDILEKNGIDVLYTRTTDIFQTPFEKARIANDADVDYFISLHRETSPFPNQYSGAKAQIYDKVGTKYEMAQNIISALSDLGFQNLGVSARPGLVLLRRTRMPAILLMVGYINSEEDNALFDNDFEGIAQAVASGILETLNPTNIHQTTFSAADRQNTAENTNSGSAYWTQMDEPLMENPWYDPEEMNQNMPAPTATDRNQNLNGSIPGYSTQYTDSITPNRNQNTDTPIPWYMNQNNGSMNRNNGSMNGSMNQNTNSMPGSMNQDFPDSMPGAQDQTIPVSTPGPITQTIEPIPGFTNHNISSVPNYASHNNGSVPGYRNQNNSNPMTYNNGQNLSGNMQNNVNQDATVVGETEAIEQQEQNTQETSSQINANHEADKDLTLYRVQVGLFRQRQNADNLLYELLERGYPAFLFCDGEFYKVQVGAYRQLGNAIIMERRLRKEGYSTLITT